MNTTSRTITGIIMILSGIGLIIASPFAAFIPLIYGIPILIIGIVIFFNKKEDKIEQIKSKGGKK
jgi:membrane-bound ClpP family serine protease